jgi:RimJ/RimL family protein N-acetyltransferase
VTWHLKRDPSVESRPIAVEDIECIRQWRNGQMDVLRQSAPISSSGQLNWWRDVYLPESSGAEPVQLLFVLLRQGDLLAYGGYTNIDWKARRAELSFLADTDLTATPRYAEIKAWYFSFLVEYGFEQLGLLRMFTETYAFRTDHIAVLESVGLKMEGRLRNHAWTMDRPVDSVIHGILESDARVQPIWSFE